MADRASDTNAVRQQIETQGAVPNIPSKGSRIWKSCFSRVLYRGRKAIKRMFCRLKDYRRIATRYDKLAYNFASDVPSPLPSASGYESDPSHKRRHTPPSCSPCRD